MEEYENISFLRHGETDYNQMGMWYTPFEAVLNQNGRKQAKDISEYVWKFNPEVIYTSPANRCIETMNIVIENHDNITVIINDNFMERDLEGLGSLTSAEIYEKYGIELKDPINSQIDIIENVENSLLFLKRVEDGVREVLSDDRRKLVVTHGGVMWAFATIFMKMNPKVKTFRNCAFFGAKEINGIFYPTFSYNMREDWYSDVNPSWKGWQL
ncbi:histidine phosphatase family protein [Caldiplasma sukawensis]